MESALYGIHALVVFVSEISLLRFQKHVLNFRTQVRSINESIHLYTVGFIGAACKESRVRQPGASGFCDRASEFCA